MDSYKELAIEKRLIVLLPVSLANNIELAHVINHMAFDSSNEVIYITLDGCSDDSLSLARSMATMKAVTAGNDLRVNWVQAESTDWLAKLQEIYRPGDVIVCHERQTIKNGSNSKENLHEYLEDTLKVDVKLISGYFPGEKRTARNRLNKILSPVGFTTIFALFTWLQIHIAPMLNGAAGKLSIFVLFLVEIGAIWVWNNFMDF